MAVDEALLEAVGRQESPPVFRLYAWMPACLSLGYAQSANDVCIEKLNEKGWDLVRRPTGGKAILHIDELTYSVIAPNDDPLVTGNVLESYRRISIALLHALELLGLPARADKEYDLSPNPLPVRPICFEVPSNYEITVFGKKLVGSAQARRKEGVLQHGALPLFGDLSRITEVLFFPDADSRIQAADRLLEHATTIERILQRKILWEDAAHCFIQAFQESLNLEFVEQDLTDPEKQRADELVAQKYAHPSWTERA